MTAATATSSKLDEVALPEQGVCNECLGVWPLDELGEDANGDPQCPDCRATSEGLLYADAAAYHSYMFAGR